MHLSVPLIVGFVLVFVALVLIIRSGNRKGFDSAVKGDVSGVAKAAENGVSSAASAVATEAQKFAHGEQTQKP